MVAKHLAGARLIALLLTTAVGTAWAADWPTERHDFARSGRTDAKLPATLSRRWTYVAAHTPRPAWPEPGRELNRLDFDYAYHVVVADGAAYFGSSADHKVTCLDLATGKERWSVFTGGPVRFAPTVSDGRVYVGSDDGCVYCLSAQDGTVIWRFRGMPQREMLLGNGRMMSRWPIRTGVGVEDGVAYFAAGMWPAEGVVVYALDADEGTVLWQNATSGSQYVKQPHPGSFAMTGVAPQGYVLGRGGQLFVPTGRNVPAAYNRATGELLYYRSAPTGWGNRWGGAWNVLAQGLLFAWRCHVGPDIDVQVGEYKPDPNDGLVVFDAETGQEKREFAGKLRVVVRGNVLYATGQGTLTAYDLKAWLGGAKAADCTLWEALLAAEKGQAARVYELIMAGNTLVAGGRGTVSAYDAAKGKRLWQDDVDGQARALAAVDGHLLVSTTTGRIICYGAAGGGEASEIDRRAARQMPTADLAARLRARRILKGTDAREGFCLALGAGDGSLLRYLAEDSKLTVYCIEPDAERVGEVRRMLDAAGLYGTRVTVHQGPLDRLAYPDYFANLILIAGETADVLERASAAELYRVLRPSGGRIHIEAPKADENVGDTIRRVVTLGAVRAWTPEAVARWLRRDGVPEDEVRAGKETVQVLRGRLPEVDDWTHQYASAARTGCSDDQRVRLPLKLLWFGKPGPARLVTRHWGGPAPLCVDGRMFVLGQRSLMAVDAYNGRPLWRRDFSRVAWWPVRARGSSAAADHDSVYLVQGKTCLRLDAETGATVDTYALPAPPSGLSADEAKNLQWRYLAVADGRVLGTMGNDKESRGVFVLNRDGQLQWAYAALGTVGHNAISMARDRVYLIDRPSPEAVARAKRRGKAISGKPRLIALGAADGKPAWETEAGLAGRDALWLSNGVLLATGRSGMTGYDATTGEVLYTRRVAIGRFPILTDDTIYAEPSAFDLRTGEPQRRTDPLTGKDAPWNFRRSYGCGSIAAGPNLLLFRSGTLGMYDLAGDSGVHNFGGVRAGCYVNAIAANGLVLCPPADAACTCSYSFRTTVALAPAEAKEKTDWSIFYDRLPNASVKQAAFNLGAPGDRRDSDGVMWLATPRPETRSRRSELATPFRFTYAEGGGPYRQQAAPTAVTGTHRPWLYTSGLEGLREAVFDLHILDRGFSAWPADPAPRVDGFHTERLWDGYKAIAVEREQAQVTLRHDEENLYIGYRRPAREKQEKWRVSAKGDDAQVWTDDSFEVYLSPVPADTSRPSRRCLHLGVSASGARYDAAWTYVSPFPRWDIPRLDVTVDGKSEDWGDGGLQVQSIPDDHGRMRPTDDLDPAFRVAWSAEGLALLVQVRDSSVVESANAGRLWEGDSVEVFLTPKLGSGRGYQAVISPGASEKQPKPRCRFYVNGRGASLRAQVAGGKTAEGYLIEVLLPWENLKVKPADGREIGVQLFVNDKDAGRRGGPFRVLWHPGGQPVSDRDPFAYHAVRLAVKASKPVVLRRAEKPDKSGLFPAAAPHPYPLSVPPLGAKGEDAGYSGQWASGAHADADGFTAELAISWKTLADAGLEREGLMVNVSSRGPLRQPPRLQRGYERLIAVPRDAIEPRTFTVRLHFAEPDDVRRGERVFDVKLQGQTVLRGFDVVRAAGGPRRAVVREFDGISADRAVTIELVPRAQSASGRVLPLLSAVELVPAG
jgi:outer membrane protein assembly factor BamB